MGSDFQRLSPKQAADTYVGEDRETKTVLTLGDLERRSGLYILGRPGMGKSTLLVNLALQDMEHGHGVFFIDPHTDAIRDILKRLPPNRKDDVLYFHITDKTHSFGINLVACKDPSDLNVREDTFEKANKVFYSLWPEEMTKGVWLAEILPYLLRALIENQEKGQECTLADAPRFLRDSDPDFRKRVVANIRYQLWVKDFWQDFFTARRSQEQERELRVALTRFNIFHSSPYVLHVVGQRKTTLDFSQLMKERKIVLVSFPANLPDETKRFLGTILVRELLWAALARARQSDRSQFCVFVDEFQNFVTPDFDKIIRQTRKFGIAPTIAQQYSLGHEYPGVDKAIEAMANLVIFQPTVADAEREAKEFADRPEPESLEVLSEEKREVVEKEDLQRIEEVVENGVEPIPTLAQQPLTYLLRGHSNPEVNRLTAVVLQPLANALQLAQAETEQAGVLEKASHEPVYQHKPDGELGILFVAKREQMLEGKQEIDRLLFDLMQRTIEYGSREVMPRLVSIVTHLRGFLGFSQGAVWEVRSELVRVIPPPYIPPKYRSSHHEPDSGTPIYAYAGEWKDTPLDPQMECLLPEMVSGIMHQVPDALQDKQSLISLSKLRETQRSFEQVRLFHLLQASQEVWLKRIEARLRINGIYAEAYQEEVRKRVRQQWGERWEQLRKGRNQLEQSSREAEEKVSRSRAVLKYGDLKELYERERRPERRAQIERLLREAEKELSEELSQTAQRGISSVVTSALDERRQRQDALTALQMEMAGLVSNTEINREARERIAREHQVINDHLIPKTIEELRENDLPPGLSGYARNVLLAIQRQALAELIPVARAEYQRFVAFLTGLCKICAALSVPEQQIIIDSNQYRPRKETKITYVMHPEKAYTKAARTLTHPRHSHADLVAEEERNLLDLAPYTAAYKLLPAGGGAPIKGVLATFELCPEHNASFAQELYRSIIDTSHASTYSMRREAIETDIQQQRQGREKKDAPAPPPRRDDEGQIPQPRQGQAKKDDDDTTPSRHDRR